MATCVFQNKSIFIQNKPSFCCDALRFEKYLTFITPLFSSSFVLLDDLTHSCTHSAHFQILTLPEKTAANEPLTSGAILVTKGHVSIIIYLKGPILAVSLY